MGHAYTPGLKVTDKILVKKRRILPLKGEVIVKVGDKVGPDDIVAQTHLPGNVVPLNVANKMSIPPEDLEIFMVKKDGDPIKQGENIAFKKGLFGTNLFSSACTATIDGTIESVSKVTGQVLQRGEPIPVQVKAYLKGEITEVIPNEGVEVSTNAAFVQGIFGIGGEVSGAMIMAAPDNTVVLTEEYIKDEMKDKVLLGGSMVTACRP